MVSFGFFNSSNGDRRYSSEDISRIFSFLITDGVLMTYGDKFFTTPSTSNLGVILGTGWAWFNHTWTMSDAKIPFALSEADPSLDRIDTIYLKVDARSLGRVNSLGLLEGSPALNPKAPTFPTETDVYYHPLAYIRVRKNVTRIAASDIEILAGKTQAPFITSILQSTDITTLFQGWSEQFGRKMTEWENELDTLETSLTSNVDALISRGNQQLSTQQSQFTAAQTARQNTFNTSITGWETEFRTWFDNLQTYLSQDVVTAIWADLDKLKNEKQNAKYYWEPSNDSNHAYNLPFLGILANGDSSYKSGMREYSNLVDYKTFMTGITNGGHTEHPLKITPKSIMEFVKAFSSISVPLVFTETTSFSAPFSGWYSFIAVGGGGSGKTGTNFTSSTVGGGGGGGGGVQILSFYAEKGAPIILTVGAGATSTNSSSGGQTKVEVGSGAVNIYGGHSGSAITTTTTYGGSAGRNMLDNILGLGGGGGGGIAAKAGLNESSEVITTRGGSSGLCGGGGGGSYIPYSSVPNEFLNSGGSSVVAGNGGVGGQYLSGSYIQSTSGLQGMSVINTNQKTGYNHGGGGGGGWGKNGIGGDVPTPSSTALAQGGSGGGGFFAKGGAAGNEAAASQQAYSGEGFGAGGGGSGILSSKNGGGGGGGGGWGWIPPGISGLAVPSSTASKQGKPGIIFMFVPVFRRR